MAIYIVQIEFQSDSNTTIYWTKQFRRTPTKHHSNPSTVWHHSGSIPCGSVASTPAKCPPDHCNEALVTFSTPDCFINDQLDEGRDSYIVVEYMILFCPFSFLTVIFPARYEFVRELRDGTVVCLQSVQSALARQYLSFVISTLFMAVDGF